MPDVVRTALETHLAGTHTIERELPGGGMSRVFVAEETALGRRVVVKVLPMDGASGVSVSRFKREIVLAARLQHPHIVPLLSAGEADGMPYFTMPLIEGESLRGRLERDVSMSLDEIVRTLREVASAVAYAHSKGIVHRDIKPENILLTRDHALVADFGVAKALSAATAEGTSGLTSAGIALGTPAYMAPEQCLADPAVDHRADVYALGVVAYELLSGRPPFAGRSPRALVAAHITERPAPIASGHGRASVPLARLVMSCLEKDPSDRPQTADEIVRQLDLLLHGGTDTRTTRPSIAVLPFVNTSGEQESEHFVDGLTDELIGTLSKVGELSVTGRTSAFAMKNKGYSIREIATILNVAHVLEGSVRRAGERIKTRVQLADAEGRVLWSDSYDRTLHDVFAVQEDIAQAVVRALEIRLGAARGPLVRPLTRNLAAYDLYLKGKFVVRRLAPQDLDRALDFFQQAATRDPEFAAAYAWLCNTHLLRVVFAGRSALDELPRAREFALKAVACDSMLADAHWAMGEILFTLDIDWTGTGIALERTLALDPGHADARHIHAIYLLAQRRFEEARAELIRVLATDPLLADASMTMARLLLSLGAPDEAMTYLHDALEIAPAFSFARGYLGHAYLMKGMIGEALAEFEQAAASGVSVDLASLAYAYGVAGRHEEARAIVTALINDLERYAPAFHIAMAYAGIGDRDEAFRWLDRALLERVPFLIGQVNIEPAFEPLRDDARFSRLLERMGFETGSSP